MKSDKTGSPRYVGVHRQERAELQPADVTPKDVTPTEGKPPGAREHSPDAFGATPLLSQDAPPPPKTRGAHALLQMLGLRSRQKHPARTEGARTTLLGVSMAGLKKAPGIRERLLKLGSVSALMLISLNLSNLPAQTVYVNVNGAKPTSSEVVGAKAAAQRARESFSMVKPGDLASVFEAANQPGGSLRKLVVSGHSSGLWISGSDDEGANSLDLADMRKHATQFPAAFDKVTSFYGMACNVGTEENSRQWFSLFPKLNALVGFDHIGPASDRPAAGAVLNLVDAELAKVNWGTLTRDRALALGKRLSQLPGVNVTEFSVRLRANDGSTVFFSKINKPTATSTASDLVDQLKPTAFTPWFDAKDTAYARPPTDHGPRSPLRQFYNATQTLLNALGRDIAQQGGDPNTNVGYQGTLAKKEAALRLIYWDVVLQNAEHHTRPAFDAVVQELSESGVALQIPKLTTLTRTQVIALRDELAKIGNFKLQGFADKHATDVATIQTFLDAQQAYPIAYGEIGPTVEAWRFNDIVRRTEELIAATDTPEGVKEAAGRVLAGLKVAPSATFAAVLKLFDDGLVQLKADAFAPDWVTTARPDV